MNPRLLRPALCVALGVLAAAPASAACLRNVAAAPSPLRLASLALAEVPVGSVGVTYVGHSSFLIETARGATIVTDYNDYVRPLITPDIVTMNNAHSTHFSVMVAPGVKHALQGWGTPERAAAHDLAYLDVQIRNVPTNVREVGGTRYNGNSIFVFETAGLCIAHLGHLHHRLTPEHLAELGQIDVLFVPVDGVWTLNQNAMLEVVEQIRSPLVIPMHFFSGASLQSFIGRIIGAPALGYEVRFSDTPSIVLSRANLPQKPELLVLQPGR